MKYRHKRTGDVYDVIRSHGLLECRNAKGRFLCTHDFLHKHYEKVRHPGIEMTSELVERVAKKRLTDLGFRQFEWRRSVLPQDQWDAYSATILVVLMDDPANLADPEWKPKNAYEETAKAIAEALSREPEAKQEPE